MRIEVQIEKKISDTFPSIWKEDPSGGRLADLVVDILKIVTPEYVAYRD